jgi:hypothetical protein
MPLVVARIAPAQREDRQREIGAGHFGEHDPEEEQLVGPDLLDAEASPDPGEQPSDPLVQIRPAVESATCRGSQGQEQQGHIDSDTSVATDGGSVLPG